MAIEEKVKSIIAELLDIEVSTIEPATKLRSELEASSIDLVELIAAIETDFDIDIPDEDAQKMRTVQDIVEHVKKVSS